jgi:prepilin-type N-terminal cleavage/methylation domain-containing protein
MTKSSYGRPLRSGRVPDQGFSLLEMIVAVAVFLVISGVAFTLFGKHQAMLSQEQLTAGLNIGMRNALAQIQLDLVNAGDGLILGTNVPAWPVGVTINNSNPTTAQCNPTASYPPVYASACFDSMNIILADQNTPAIHPCASSSSCTINTSSTSTLTGFSSSNTASTFATNFHSGDSVLFVQGCSGGGHPNGSSGCMFTTAVLTSAGSSTTCTGITTGCVVLNFNSTSSTGTNSTTNDPYSLTTNTPTAELTAQFGYNDWVVRLAPIAYSVTTSTIDSYNNSDPQLVRQQGGTTNVLMDQIIGFKVGAALWNAASDTTTFSYNYNAQASTSAGGYASNYELIRSVRVSLIGRTEPNPTNIFRNTFDSGPYQIRGNSIIVNPRNLTMNND